MADLLVSVSDFIRDWGIQRFLEIVVGVIGLIALMFVPMGNIDYSSGFDGLIYSVCVVAAGVLLVVARPMIWLGPVDWIYSFAFCMVVAAVASFRWLILGQRSVVLIKATDDDLASASNKIGKSSEKKS